MFEPYGKNKFPTKPFRLSSTKTEQYLQNITCRACGKKGHKRNSRRCEFYQEYRKQRKELKQNNNGFRTFNNNSKRRCISTSDNEIEEFSNDDTDSMSAATAKAKTMPSIFDDSLQTVLNKINRDAKVLKHRKKRAQMLLQKNLKQLQKQISLELRKKEKLQKKIEHHTQQLEQNVQNLHKIKNEMLQQLQDIITSELLSIVVYSPKANIATSSDDQMELHCKHDFDTISRLSKTFKSQSNRIQTLVTKQLNKNMYKKNLFQSKHDEVCNLIRHYKHRAESLKHKLHAQ